MFEIRRAVPSDACAILEFTKKAGRESDNLTFDENGLDFDIESEKALIEKLHNSTQGLLLVAVNDDEVVGLASILKVQEKRMNHRGELAVAVLKDWQNKGIGTNLFALLVQYGQSHMHCDSMFLEVRSDNEKAIHLYEKFGFRSIGTYPGYMKVNDELIDCEIMIKTC